MNLLDKLRAFFDPRGPIGEVISPSEVFKERLGLPTTSPHAVRAVLDADRLASIEAALAIAPTRFVAADDALDVPRNRERQISAFVMERWEPVYEKTTATNIFDILKASETLLGWNVTYQPVRARQRITNEDFIEIAQTCQIQARDDFYNQYYETIRGNDPVVIDGEILRGEAVYEILEDGSQGKMLHDGTVRGGTMITKGRREYREATRGYIHWDKGFLKEHQAALAEEASRPMRNVQAVMESIAGEKLPMHRPVMTNAGLNFRRDRRSAV